MLPILSCSTSTNAKATSFPSYNTNMAAFVPSLPPTTQPNPTTYCLWKGSSRRTHGGGSGCSFTSTARHALSDIYLRDESSWSSSLMTASSSSSSISMADVNSWGQTSLQRDLVLWLLTTTTVPSDDTTQTTIPYFNTVNDDGATTQLQRSSASILLSSSSSSSSTAYRPLTQAEISLLQKAFASYYDNSNKNVEQAKELLGECISIWISTSQSGDEIAALYRVRGDVNMVSTNRYHL